MVYKIISGGQTGVDRAALDVALEMGIACGGWCPKGRLAEDGVLDAKYPLLETPQASNSQRTEWNVRDSEATIILTWGPISGGTVKAVAMAKRLRRPLLLLDMKTSPTIAHVQEWIESARAHVLHIGGPRASEVPEAYEAAFKFLKELFTDE